MYCINHPDIITSVVSQLHTNLQPTDYKAILRINHTWYKIAKNAQYERDHINALATVISRNLEKNWNFPLTIPYLTSELIEQYFCIDKTFNDDKIEKSFNEQRHARSTILKTFYNYISNSKLTPDLIINNIGRLNLTILYKNPCYTIDLHNVIHKNTPMTHSYHESSLYLNPNFTIKWIEDHHPRNFHNWKVRSIIDDKVVKVNELIGDIIEDSNGNFIMDEFDLHDLDLWDDVISQPMLSSDQFEKYKPQFTSGTRDWFQHATLSREFALKYIKTHEAVIANKAVTCDLIEELLPVIKTHPNWEIYLSRNPNITIEFINTHPEIRLSQYEIMLHCRDIRVIERYFSSMLGLLWWQ